MIVTVTPNPSLDRTLHLDRFVHQGVNRVRYSMREPSGKGVNVSLALETAGTPTIAVLPLGGPAGLELADLLIPTGLQVEIVPIAGTVRSNLSLVELDGSTTKVNEPGPHLSATEVATITNRALSVSRADGWLAYCGSLTRGFSSSTLVDAVHDARNAGRRVAVDTSEEALQTLLRTTSRRMPTVIKPNTHELAAATGRPIATIGELVQAAHVLLGRGVETVLVSMGGDGAILLDKNGPLHGQAPVGQVVNTVGAGDSFLAGYLHACDAGLPREDALATALRWGAIAVQHAGTIFPGPSVNEVSVRLDAAPDTDRRLDEPAA